MSLGRRVLVVLSAPMDAAVYKAKHNAGAAADDSPWGYGHLAEHGWDVTYTRTTKPRLPMRLLQLAVRRTTGIDLIHALNNLDKLRRVDVVVGHLERDTAAFVVISSALRHSPKFVVNSIWSAGEWPRYSGLKRAMLKLAFARAERLTFNALPARDEMASHLGSDRCRYVPFGIAVGDFFQDASESIQRLVPEAASSLMVLVPGNDSYRDWATVSAVAKSLPHLHFVVASSTAPAGISALGNVSIVIPAGPREMRLLYTAALCCFVPTRPNLHASGITVIMEAVSVGTPVVTPNHGGIQDYFSEEHLIFVDAESSNSAVDAISYIESDSAHVRPMTDLASRHMMEQNYTSSGFAARVGGVLDELMN